ncbi:MAG: ABC transporter ATP-binding protein [Peptococcaceae bacterium]|nr:ABC transporter ATP-binding protein [Peptococcaceae bacterium]
MITARGVSKIFGESATSKRYGLRDINLDIKAGEFVVILGHSGAGKTTLINILSALDSPTMGSIEYDETNITKLRGRKLTKFRKEYIGFVFQQFHLVETLTTYENIEFAARMSKATKHQIRELLARMGLSSKENDYPFQLSGGEQQRVAVARALAKKPKVLFCDEPTGALDEENGKMVLSLINGMNKQYGLTVVIVTHNPMIASMANRIITMKNGSIITNHVKRAQLDIYTDNIREGVV